MADEREITAEELEKFADTVWKDSLVCLPPTPENSKRYTLQQESALYRRAAHTLRKREERIRELEGAVEAAYKQGCSDGMFYHPDDAWEQSKFRRWLVGDWR